VDDEAEPTILGFPAEVTDDDAEPATLDQLVVLRRADRFAGGVLVLAGVAANLSLLLPWFPGEGTTGLSLVRQAVDVLGAGVGGLVRSDLWPPLAVVLAGGLLSLLGLLLFLPARAHRVMGLLALLASSAAAVAVFFLLAGVDWNPGRFGPGMPFAVAVPALGVPGALKAMLTAPRVAMAPR
jgi:hypothetical protein